MQEGCKILGVSQAIGMGEGVSLGKSLLTELHGLYRKTQTPQGVRRQRQTRHAWRYAMPERLGALRCRVDKEAPPLEMRPGGGVVAQPSPPGDQRDRTGRELLMLQFILQRLIYLVIIGLIIMGALAG